MAQTVKNMLTIQETRVRSPSQEDSPEKEMATQPHSSILAWRIPWTEEYLMKTVVLMSHKETVFLFFFLETVFLDCYF